MIQDATFLMVAAMFVPFALKNAQTVITWVKSKVTAV